MPERGTDHRTLRDEAYADSTKLRSRAALYDFKVPPSDFLAWCLESIDWPDGALVVDVGCGPGAHLRRLASDHRGLRLVGLDLSDGMAAEAHAGSGASAMVGDAQRLPIRDGVADRVLAMHMLYHLADIDGAVAELRRVLRPGGVLLVVTNGAEHLDGFRVALSEATGGSHWFPVADRFLLEDAPAPLGRHFADVVVHHHRGEVVVPIAEPVMAYAGSARAFAEPMLPDGVTWDMAMARFDEVVRDEIGRTGAWRATVHTGVVVCR